MVRIYPKIKRGVNHAFLYLQKVGNGRHEHILVKIGETIIIEGGPSTGKTEFLKKTIRQLTENGEKALFVNAALPMSDWVKEFKLFGKNLDSRVDCLLRTLPDTFYLLIDNAEKITDSRKLELALLLIEKSRSSVIACSNFTHLISKLKVRLKDAKVHSLGAGADTFDVTYFVVAMLIIFVALTGSHSIIFLAAAFRYLFQGTRMGGRKV
ncbi:MAG: hypothetical protein HZA15_15955 [Nitrospirae bacterium]|nr:hypothetical protein [Nitrospirota bacterium]